MIRKTLFIVIILSTPLWQGKSQTKDLANKILGDERLEVIRGKGLQLLSTGFNAGSGYQEVWIRDFNTFIAHSLEVLPPEEVREALLRFLFFQGFDGNIIDGYQPVGENDHIDYYGRYTRYDMPGYAFHKNTVETDQETSLVQAFYKYVKITGDTSILQEAVNGRKAIDRLEMALNFLMKHRYNEHFGLLWGATTADWGDVQPGHPWGVKLDEYSVPAIDIYDNAMFVIALDNFMTLEKMGGIERQEDRWSAINQFVRENIRTHLWDEQNQKFIPHIYIREAAFPELDNENTIFYHGGTAVAIQAGLLSKQEIAVSLEKMKQNVKAADAQTIGLTLYPVYPEGSFLNPQMVPWGYQNGGDWTWFGARMITALVQNGYAKEAYEELEPMLDRVIENDGFFEWYTIDGKPKGSGLFRGSAGVLLEAIDALREWAREYAY